jgi:phosphatidylinositol alpha-1,6-mannosyltransferase
VEGDASAPAMPPAASPERSEAKCAGAPPAASLSARRLLVLTELFLPTKGGTAVWFDELYRRLGGAGIHIVTADVAGAADHDRVHPNRIHRLKLQRHWWLRPESLAMYAKFLVASARLAVTHRFEAVHAGRVLPEGLIALVVARLTGRPCVVYAHGEEITTWRQWRKLRAMRFVYRGADRVIANSEFTRDELMKLGVQGRRIAIVNPGVDIRRFRPGIDAQDLRDLLSIGSREHLILSVGRLSRRKGFDQVIRALPKLAARGIDARYALIGVGEDRAHLESLARELGVVDRIRFLGHVAVEELPRWYNAADVVAMPNREIDGDTEGFGMVFIEAAACGKPVLAGRAGGTGAAVLDGETGLRVDGASLEAVVEGLDRILSSPGLAQELGGRGYERAVSAFAWERVAERVAALAD